jgi:hypothetical protein
LPVATASHGHTIAYDNTIVQPAAKLTGGAMTPSV